MKKSLKVWLVDNMELAMTPLTDYNAYPANVPDCFFLFIERNSHMDSKHLVESL